MQDNELKKTLKNIDIPAPSDEAKARALQVAMQAFEEVQEQYEVVRAQLQPVGGAVEQREPSLFTEQDVIASTFTAGTRRAAA